MPQFKTMVDIYQDMIGRNANENINFNVLNENASFIGRYETDVGLEIFVTDGEIKADDKYLEILASDRNDAQKLELLKELMLDIASAKLQRKLVELESEGIKISVGGFNTKNIRLFTTFLSDAIDSSKDSKNWAG